MPLGHTVHERGNGGLLRLERGGVHLLHGLAGVDHECAAGVGAVLVVPRARGLHSSTFRLNVSAFDGIGGAFRGCLGGV